MLLALLYALLRPVIVRSSESGSRNAGRGHRLRHQVAVLSREVGGPKLRRIDKAFLTACSRGVSRHRWGSFIVAPSTLLGWHRELVRRKWRYKQERLGRPPIDPALAALISRRVWTVRGRTVLQRPLRGVGAAPVLVVIPSLRALVGAVLDAAPGGPREAPWHRLVPHHGQRQRPAGARVP
jgi:hypothetical protein